MTQQLHSPSVVSIVAKSNSGKTTLIERLIPELQSRGLRVGVLKHHHRLSSFDTPGKDTHRIAEAGADIVVGVSPVQVAVFRREPGSADLDGVIERQLGDVDLILVEGYKRGSYPKVEVHRAARSETLICDPEELIAIVSDTRWEIDVPCFALDDIEEVADLLVDVCGLGTPDPDDA